MQVLCCSRSPQETLAIGRAVGEKLEGGDVVCLFGQLGAGKTCLAQGIALGLAVPEDAYVSSPSFVIVNEYQGRVPVYHVDLFRAASAGEVERLGLLEYFEGPGVTIIEWAEKAAHLVPRERVDVRVRASAELSRVLVFDLLGADETSWGRLAEVLHLVCEGKDA